MPKYINNCIKLSSLAWLAAFYLHPAAASASNEAAGGAAALFTGLFVTGIFSLWFLFVSLIMLVNIGGLVIWIIMLIDCAKRDFPEENDKMVWILVIALTSWIGALIYYFMIKRKDQVKPK